MTIALTAIDLVVSCQGFEMDATRPDAVSALSWLAGLALGPATSPTPQRARDDLALYLRITAPWELKLDPGQRAKFDSSHPRRSLAHDERRWTRARRVDAPGSWQIVGAAAIELVRGGPPRELRHSFVSLLSAHDVALEEISRLVGHSGTNVTEKVCRHEIRPALTKGATAMNKILKSKSA